jgi:DNA repair protein RadC
MEHVEGEVATGAQRPLEAFRVELRLARWELDPGLELPTSPKREEVARFLFDLVREEPVEVFGAIYFDESDRAVGYTMPYRGAIRRVAPEKRHLLIKAWMCRASSLVVFHNHPSGTMWPSDEDLGWTRSFLALAAPLGIEVRDHLILGHEPEVYSMAARRDVPGLGQPADEVWSHREVEEWLEAREREMKGRRRRRATPKYREPATGETWAGRGSMAGWLRRYLEAGRELEEFRLRP